MTLSAYCNYKTQNKVLNVCLLGNPMNLEEAVVSRVTSRTPDLTYTYSRVSVKVKVKVTLRLAVYRQSVRLRVKSLETHDQRIFLSTEPLQ
jgi:hypothetical protein